MKKTTIKILEAGSKAADKLIEEAATDILVLSGLGLLCSLGAAILKKGGEKKES